MVPIAAITSMPFTFFVSNDACCFGVLPIMTIAAITTGAFSIVAI